jgi:hypothetical protein
VSFRRGAKATAREVGLTDCNGCGRSSIQANAVASLSHAPAARSGAGSGAQALGGGERAICPTTHLREVEHVRREERLAVLRKVLLVGVEEAIEPRQPALHAVVSVQDHRDAVEVRDLADVQRGRDAAGDARGVLLVVGGLAGDELAAAA